MHHGRLRPGVRARSEKYPSEYLIQGLAHDVDAEGVGEVRLEVVALEERGGGAERSPVATMLSIQCLVSWIVIAVSRVKLIPRGTVLQSPYRGQEMRPDQRLVDRRDPTGG